MLSNFYAPLSKIEPQDDGSIRITAIASSENIDASGEIVKAEAIKAALPDFFKFGTGALREMHGLSAAGTVDEASIGDDNITRIVATVVDENAIKKCLAGVYKGVSIGGKVKGRDKTNAKIITDLMLVEISLVDRPCNPDAKLELFKAELPVDDPVEKVDPVVEVEQVAVVDPLTKANDAVDRLEAALDVKKSMYTVSSFADTLQSISYLVRSSERELDELNDNSSVPDLLRTWVVDGARIFRTMAIEDIDRLISQVTATKKAAEAEDLAKAEATAKEAADKLVSTEASAIEATKKADDLAKRLAERDEQLTKIAERIDPLVKAVAEMTERMTKLEDSPAPPKTAGPGAVHISKGDDASGNSNTELSDDDITKALAAMSEEDRAFLLIKASHRLPQIISR